MAVRHRLPGVPAQLPGLRFRRRRRSAGRALAPRLPAAPRSRCDLALPRLRLTPGGQRLRHQRLPGHRPPVRDDGGLHCPPGRRPRPGHEAHHGPRRQPHLHPARVVPRVPLPLQPQARLVLLAARPPRPLPRRARIRAQQLGVLLLRSGLVLRRGVRRVLPPPVRPRAGGPKLGEPPGAPGRLRHDELVARPGGRRLPRGRDRHDREGGGPARRRTGAPALRRRLRALRGPPPPARLPPGDAPRGPRGPPRRVHRGRDLQRQPGQRPAVLRSRPPRVQFAHPVRARQPGDRGGQVLPPCPARRRARQLLVPLAGRSGRTGLELPVPRQPRPAPLRLPIRGSGALARLGDRAGDDAAVAAGHPLRLPGPGTGDDERGLHLDRPVPRRRVAQLLRAGPRRRCRRADRPVRPGAHVAGQRPHPHAVGHLAQRRLHHRNSVDRALTVLGVRGGPRHGGSAGGRPRFHLLLLPGAGRTAPPLARRRPGLVQPHRHRGRPGLRLRAPP